MNRLFDNSNNRFNVVKSYDKNLLFNNSVFKILSNHLFNVFTYNRFYATYLKPKNMLLIIELT